MPTYVPAPVPRFGFSGTASYKVYTYESNSLTPITTWSDQGSTPNANPVVLDQYARAQIFILAGTTYRFIYKDSSDVTVYDQDYILIPGGIVGDDLTVADDLVVTGDSTFTGATAGVTQWLAFSVSAEDEVITSGTGKFTFRLPACTVQAVRASLKTASSSGTPTIDINEGGTTILSTKLTIDANEKTSTTAATAAVISDATIADDAEMTIDIDVSGTNAAGLKVYMKVKWTA